MRQKSVPVLAKFSRCVGTMSISRSASSSCRIRRQAVTGQSQAWSTPQAFSARCIRSQAHLNKVARQLNERPRETLQFETPAERFNACVASTG